MMLNLQLLLKQKIYVISQSHVNFYSRKYQIIRLLNWCNFDDLAS